MKVYLRSLKKIFIKMPLYTVGKLIYFILQYMQGYVVNVLFLKVIVDYIAAGRNLPHIFVYLFYLAAFLIICDLYAAAFRQGIEPVAIEKLKKLAYEEIRELVSGQELYCYDDTKFYNEVVYISRNIVDTQQSVIESIFSVLAGGLSVIMVFHTFWQVGGGLIIISVIAVVFTLLIDTPIIKWQNQKKVTNVPFERKKKYLFSSFFNRESCKEIRTTDVSELLKENLRETARSLKENHKKYNMRLFGLSFIKEFVSSALIMKFVLILYLLHRIIVQHTLSYGEFISCFNGADMAISTVLQLLSYISVIRSDSMVLKQYENVMARRGQDIGEQKTEDVLDFQSIELKDVSFAYPGTDKTILKHICMKINRNDKIAIVGKNGSGKTTLCHLLMGLYEPTSGEILIDGTLLDRRDLAAYRAAFSSYFQESKVFSATIAENVALNTEYDDTNVHRTLNRLSPEKLGQLQQDRVLGREFDRNGLLLSGGELQKLLIANSLYSKKRYIMMDEPSSALDPVAEKKFNQILFDLTVDATTVLISHRLSTVRMADYIYVLENGCIVERGTHEELLNRRGVYSEMWRIQAEKYGQ